MMIETERTIVRKFTAADAEDLYEIFGDAETMENVEPPYDFAKTVDFLQKFCIERGGALACAQKESGKLIGYILFCESDEGVYEIGWIFNRRFWRQGYANESCRALMDYAFAELHAHKIFAEAIDAVKSVDLMKKLGMELEGIQKSQTLNNRGEWSDLYFYGKLAE